MTPCGADGVSIAPQGNFCQERSYVLRTRMRSTSQKPIAYGSCFWGVTEKVTKNAL